MRATQLYEIFGRGDYFSYIAKDAELLFERETGVNLFPGCDYNRTKDFYFAELVLEHANEQPEHRKILIEVLEVVAKEFDKNVPVEKVIYSASTAAKKLIGLLQDNVVLAYTLKKKN